MSELTHMTDCQGQRVRVGSRVMVMGSKDDARDRGKVLTVRAVKIGACGRKGWACRADDAKSDEASERGDFTICSWLWPDDIGLVPE